MLNTRMSFLAKLVVRVIAASVRSAAASLVIPWTIPTAAVRVNRSPVVVGSSSGAIIAALYAGGLRAAALEKMAQRSMQLQCTIQDGQIWLTDGETTVEIPREVWKA